MKITDEMINRADNVLSRVKGGIPDATIRLAIEAALSDVEPVAWRSRHSAQENWYYSEGARSWWECQPLYAAPPAPSVVVKAWTAEDEAREYRSFSEWFKERGYPKYPEHYSLVCENAMHAAWQEAAKRSALSAQVQDVKTFINLNSRARVKLTKHGKIILEMYEYTTEKPDAEGFLEMHLWELMRVFGPVMFNGNPNLPFENMNVELLG